MVRLLRSPSLRAATTGTFAQRLIAFTAMVLMVSVVLFWPEIRDGAGRAVAQSQDNNYQPFACGQNNSSTLQQRRQSLQLKNGSGGNGSAYAYPCVSGVKWKLSVGCTRCDTSAGSTSNGAIVGVINNAFATDGKTLYFAGTGSATDLVQVGIQGLEFCRGSGDPSRKVNSYGCNQAVSGVQLTADSTDSGSFNITNDYLLNIDPAGSMNVGGLGMMADVWGTEDSEFEVPKSAISLGSLCGTVATSTGNGCTANLSQFSGTLLTAIAGGTVLPLVGINLTFYYLITHTPSATDPYNESASNNSVVLPNTRIVVGNGS
ncbi:MAG: hypothetical protein QM572_13090 [Nocardioides sp.]|uniref:hypothetical protein n=1 Tax=Nocardioides sp. TaxID=35761 RepID=UPI0039E3A72F